jgi:hypothetical protein
VHGGQARSHRGGTGQARSAVEALEKAGVKDFDISIVAGVRSKAGPKSGQ